MSDTVLHGDALIELRKLPDNSIDALCCDPPAGIAFMLSKERQWDSDKGGRKQWIAWLTSIMTEVYRVLKPGAHGLVWALPRTSHWTGTALEDAGFEIRDCIYHLYSKHDKLQAFMETLSDEQRAIFEQLIEDDPMRLHLFGSGFPKSHNVSVAIDKLLGCEREVIGRMEGSGIRSYQKLMQEHGARKYAKGLSEDLHVDGVPITKPATPEAQQWNGWGSATKPACEQWWLIRKPLSESSIAKNVMTHGTGALNIDGCRVEGDVPQVTQGVNTNGSGYKVAKALQLSNPHTNGRFPSHLLLSHSLHCTDEQCSEYCPVAVLDAQSGVRKTGNIKPYTYQGGMNNPNASVPMFASRQITGSHVGDTGTASRYFAQFRPDAPFIYAPKASRRDRTSDGTVNNTHSTVKSQQLMRYMLKLITPPNGIVLDCFAGSGSTLVAAISEGFHYIGIEQEAEYIEIINARIAHANGKLFAP